MTTLITSFRTN